MPADRENLPEIDFDSTFADMIKDNAEHDVGIVAFEKEAQDDLDALKLKFAELAGGFSTDLSEEFERKFNKKWWYDDKVATVTGRVYLADEDQQVHMPTAWGDPEVDEQGRSYYYLVNVTLRSHGIEVAPNVDEETEKVSDVKLAYVFSVAEDDFKRPFLTAFAGELSRHDYLRPTPEEACRQLEKRWPEEAKLLKTLLKPGDDISVPNRIAMIARELQPQLANSDEFLILAEQYVDHNLDLKSDLAYALIVDKEVTLFQGDDIHSDDASQYWHVLSLAEPFAVGAYEPRVVFNKHSDAMVHANLVVSIYNGAQPEPENIAVLAEHIVMFRPTFAQQSLASRAIQGSQNLYASLYADEKRERKEKEAERLRGEALADVSDSNGPLSLAVRKRQRMRQKPSKYIDGKPRQIAAIEDALESMKTIAGEIRDARRTVYATADEARRASGEFVIKNIKPHLQGLIDTNTRLQFNGRNILEPNVSFGGVIDEEESDTVFAFRINSNPTLVAIDEADIVLATPHSIEPYIREEHDQNGAIVGYVIFPSIVADRQTDIKPMLNWQGQHLMHAAVTKRVVVPMDGAAEVRNQALEVYNEIRQAFISLADEYGQHPIVGRMQKLQRVLSAENPANYSTLTEPRYVRTIGRTVEAMSHEGTSVTTAMQALDAVLTERTVRISGELYHLEDTVLVPVPPRFDSSRYGYKITDVRNDIIGQRPVLVLDWGTGIPVYAPLDSIESFQF